MKSRMSFLFVMFVASTSLAAAPKLINEKRVFPSSEPTWKTPQQFHLWAMRLSPDGKTLLYNRATSQAPLTPEGAPDWQEVQYEMVLRELDTGKETVLPINPLDAGWQTVFTRFNMFDPSAGRLCLANIIVKKKEVSEHATLVEPSMAVVIYDTSTGELIPTGLRGRTAIAKFDRTGGGLIGMTRRARNGWLFTAALPGLKVKPLSVQGMLQSVCPTADVVCVWSPPKRTPPAEPGQRPRRGPQRLFLYDLKAGKEIAELPIHQRNSKLDDWETQWTDDGRYLYYYDVQEDPAAESPAPQRKLRTMIRIWDRLAGRQAGQFANAVAVGPGPTATTMVLAQWGQASRTGLLLHDAVSGQVWSLGDATMQLIHAYGNRVVYARRLADGGQGVFLAEFDLGSGIPGEPSKVGALR